MLQRFPVSQAKTVVRRDFWNAWAFSGAFPYGRPGRWWPYLRRDKMRNCKNTAFSKSRLRYSYFRCPQLPNRTMCRFYIGSVFKTRVAIPTQILFRRLLWHYWKLCGRTCLQSRVHQTLGPTNRLSNPEPNVRRSSRISDIAITSFGNISAIATTFWGNFSHSNHFFSWISGFSHSNQLLKQL
jgi:hypothetical protein